MKYQVQIVATILFASCLAFSSGLYLPPQSGHCWYYGYPYPYPCGPYNPYPLAAAAGRMVDASNSMVPALSNGDGDGGDGREGEDSDSGMAQGAGYAGYGGYGGYGYRRGYGYGGYGYPRGYGYGGYRGYGRY